MVEIDTLFQTKMAKKTYPLAWHIPIAYNYKGLPPGVKNMLQIMSLAAYTSETNNLTSHAPLMITIGWALKT